MIVGKFIRLCRLPIAKRKRAALRLAARALRDERGGEILEYSLIAGLIVIGAISAIGCIGNKVVARWSSINASM